MKDAADAPWATPGRSAVPPATQHHPDKGAVDEGRAGQVEIHIGHARSASAGQVLFEPGGHDGGGRTVQADDHCPVGAAHQYGGGFDGFHGSSLCNQAVGQMKIPLCNT